MPKRYKVEHEFTYGWNDAGWRLSKGTDGASSKRMTFTSKKEAQAEINDVCEEMGYDPKTYRVAEV